MIFKIFSPLCRRAAVSPDRPPLFCDLSSLPSYLSCCLGPSDPLRTCLIFRQAILHREHTTMFTLPTGLASAFAAPSLPAGLNIPSSIPANLPSFSAAGVLDDAKAKAKGAPVTRNTCLVILTWRRHTRPFPAVPLILALAHHPNLGCPSSSSLPSPCLTSSALHFPVLG